MNFETVKKISRHFTYYLLSSLNISGKAILPLKPQLKVFTLRTFFILKKNKQREFYDEITTYDTYGRSINDYALMIYAFKAKDNTIIIFSII